MKNSFRDLRKKMSPEAQKAVSLKTQQLLQEMPLQELRQAYHMSQEDLAARLSKKQAHISRMERRTDMYISSLRNYIEAMGGELDIVARFPEGEVHISQFKNIEGDIGVAAN
jgi:ribosome-binding protein aMBF1 (putative translation factor)